MTRTIFSTYISVFIVILAFVIAMRVALRTPRAQAISMEPVVQHEQPQIATLHIRGAFLGTTVQGDTLSGIVDALRLHDLRARIAVHAGLESALPRMRALHTYLRNAGIPASAIDLHSIGGLETDSIEVSLSPSEGT